MTFPFSIHFDDQGGWVGPSLAMADDDDSDSDGDDGGDDGDDGGDDGDKDDDRDKNDDDRSIGDDGKTGKSGRAGHVSKGNRDSDNSDDGEGALMADTVAATCKRSSSRKVSVLTMAWQLGTRMVCGSFLVYDNYPKQKE